mmetsp:Transcript_1732/g.4250  ORF Transcript_1732/g.4250 Transcript_1732/m.4250 type:complete len:101 (+) Transcript_1732:684-986(+)
MPFVHLTQSQTIENHVKMHVQQFNVVGIQLPKIVNRPIFLVVWIMRLVNICLLQQKYQHQRIALNYKKFVNHHQQDTIKIHAHPCVNQPNAVAIRVSLIT